MMNQSVELKQNTKSVGFGYEPRALKLHRKLATQVQTERKITHDVLLTIQEFDITKSYLELGYSSLYDYLTKGHGYSEGAANRRISSARLLKQNPEISSKIKEGKLNLSQLALAQSAIKQEEKAIREKSLKNQDLLPRDQKQKNLKDLENNHKEDLKALNEKKTEVLKSLEGQNGFDTKKTLLNAFENFELPKSRITPTKTKKVQVILEFEEKDWDLIQSLKAHMSHKVPDQKLESLLLYWANQLNKKRQKVQSTNPALIQADVIQTKIVQCESAKIQESFVKVYNMNSASKSISDLNTDAESKMGLKSKDNSKTKTDPNLTKNSKVQTNSNLKKNSKLQTNSNFTAAIGQSPPQRRRISWKSALGEVKDQNQDQKAQKSLFRNAKRLPQNKRNYIPVSVKKLIFQKAQYQCEYHSPLTNERCQSQSYLDTEHITPIALGGSDDQTNLRVMCRAHNHLLAKQMHLLKK